MTAPGGTPTPQDRTLNDLVELWAGWRCTPGGR
jgi:hypothetical protein